MDGERDRTDIISQGRMRSMNHHHHHHAAHPGQKAEEAGRDDKALVTPISSGGCRANEQADEWAKLAVDARHGHGVEFLRYGVRYERTTLPPDLSPT